MITFEPEVRLLPRANQWQPSVLVIEDDRDKFRYHYPNCDTRWGAKRVAKRMARKLTKALERGEV